MKEKEYLVYLITNKTNGKQYVGQTCKSAIHRWKQHLSEARRNGGHALGGAIRKYGDSSFHVCVLREGLTKTEADEEEDLGIQTLQTMDDNFGYNLARGGSHGSRPKRPDVKTRDLVVGYESGKTIYQLAKQYGITFTGVSFRLREAGVKMRKGGYQERNDIPPQELAVRYSSGESSASLAKEFGASQITIQRILRPTGILRKNPGTKKREDVTNEMIFRLYFDEMMSCQQIADKFGMSFATIRNRFRRAGVPRRPQGFRSPKTKKETK